MESNSPQVDHLKDLYALSWTYAQDGKLAVDLTQGTVMDANPAFEKMVGYSRKELIGRQVIELHPEAERELVRIEMSRGHGYPALHQGFHLTRRDGQLVPVQIWTSQSLTFSGREMAIGEFRDITNRLQYQLEASAKNWALSAFSSATVALSNAKTPEDLKESICEAITQNSAYALAWIGIAEDNPEKSVHVAACSGDEARYLEMLKMTWAEDDVYGKGPTGTALRTNAVQYMDDCEEPRFAPWRERALKHNIRSNVAVPFGIGDGQRAVLTVYSASTGSFHSGAVEVFKRLGEQIAHGLQALHRKQLLELERQRLETARKHLTDVLAATVGAMVTAMEARDPYTAGHESRVADICVAIGREMGWDEGRLLGMRLGAMVHDIGKISIPTEILARPGRLKPAEYAIVKAHPETGYSILKGVPFTWPVAEMVRQHHEKLDGSGYPLGIQGDQILLESRVLAVADMVEAMASDRPYRRARGLEFALNQVESEAGTLLDAEVVRVCAALFREKRLVVPGLDWI